MEFIAASALGMLDTEDDSSDVPIRKLYVSNFPFNSQPDQIKTRFSEFGVVKDVYLQKIQGGPKCYAFVTFQEESGAKAARQNPVYMQKRKLVIRPADAWHQPDFKDFHQMVVDEAVEQNVDNTILKLNDDCLLNILRYLPVKDLLSAERVCWRFRSVAEMIYKTYRVFDSEKFHLLSPVALRTLLYNIGPYTQTLHIKFQYNTNKNMQLLRFAAQYCTSVTVLHLCGIDISYKIKNIQNLFKKLTKLEIEACSVTDQSLIYLMRTAENQTVTELNLASNHMLNGKCLPTFNQIKSLNLHSCSSIEPRYFIEFLRENPQLEELNIVLCDKIDTDCIQEVAKLQHLRCLAISNGYDGVPNVKSYCVLKQLKTLTHLRICYVNHGVLDDMLMEFSEEQVPLQHLDLTSGHMTKKCLQAILNFKSLRVLVLNRKKDCDDEVLKKIAKLRTLEEFSMASCHNVTDEGVEEVVRLNRDLRKIDVSSCQFLSPKLIPALVAITKDRPQMLTVHVGGASMTLIEDTYLQDEEAVEKRVADNLKLALSSPYNSYPGSSDEESSDEWLDEYDYWDDYDDDDSSMVSADSEYAGRLFMEILRHGRF